MPGVSEPYVLARRTLLDALDIYRLLAAIPTPSLAARYPMLRQATLSHEVAVNALTYLEELFGAEGTPGSHMAGQAVFPLDDPDVVAASCAALAQDLLTAAHSS